GLCFVERGSYALAAQHYRAAIALDARDINPLFNLAQLHEREGRLALARQTYAKLLAIESFPPARERLTALGGR
ncbi:MAG: tetratricopeptide repeat protein, partial [Planctomycetes bacterium]|nr:tetratricopeptide repeat protein [Planctomycetota bacterium]